jgi:hypothetical protein
VPRFERDQDEILMRPGDPRRSAKDALLAGRHFGTCRRSELGACDRAMEFAAEIGFAIELNIDVADDVLPERQPAVSRRSIRCELGRHHLAPCTTPCASLEGFGLGKKNPHGSRVFLPSWSSDLSELGASDCNGPGC